MSVLCMCVYMRSFRIQICDKLVQLCMLSGKAYHGTVFEPFPHLLALLYLLCPKKPRGRADKTGRGQQNQEGLGVGYPLQLGEMVRLRRQLHVKHLRMFIVMCMRGPKLKRRL